ncbi:hypothetical protein TUM4445_00580 [Shewanella sp. MBTL60-112-B2]|nr:hypothetical protein TUM4444_01790 [Shewanella sp. MBTL60-112-B1]GIU24006.1 hypothetical protein TUM4445_00580 [Shewanella sp. MBTL60-112-B2]
MINPSLAISAYTNLGFRLSFHLSLYLNLGKAYSQVINNLESKYELINQHYEQI